MKHALILISLFLFTSSYASAGKGHWKNHKKAKKQSEYKKPVVVKAIGFKARKKDGVVKLSWKRYKRSDFLYYKVMRGDAKNPNPIYPEANAIHYADKSKETRFIDEDFQDGPNHYRVCIITKNKYRWISPVITIHSSGSNGVSNNTQGANDFE